MTFFIFYIIFLLNFYHYLWIILFLQAFREKIPMYERKFNVLLSNLDLFLNEELYQ